MRVCPDTRGGIAFQSVVASGLPPCHATGPDAAAARRARRLPLDKDGARPSIRANAPAQTADGCVASGVTSIVM
ncbi:hypothetical protein GCM10027039_11000 [Terrabacter koreensis]